MRTLVFLIGCSLIARIAVAVPTDRVSVEEAAIEKAMIWDSVVQTSEVKALLEKLPAVLKARDEASLRALMDKTLLAPFAPEFKFFTGYFIGDECPTSYTLVGAKVLPCSRSQAAKKVWLIQCITRIDSPSGSSVYRVIYVARRGPSLFLRTFPDITALADDLYSFDLDE